MKRQINFRFLALLLVGGAVTGVAVYLLHHFQFRRNAHALLERAEHAEREQDLVRAVAYYDRYLRFFPAETTALAKFGFALDDLGAKNTSRKTRERAYYLLEGVLLRDPDNTQVRLRCATLAMEPFFRRFKEAKTHLEILRKLLPENADVLYRLGICAEADGKFDDAAEKYQEAIQLASYELTYSLRLATLQWGNPHKRKEAKKTLDDMVSRDPKNVQAHLDRASFFVQTGGSSQDPEALRAAAGAITATEEAISKNKLTPPKNGELIVLSATLFQAQGEVEEARKLLSEGIKKHSEVAQMYLALAQLEVKDKKLARAREILQQGRDRLPQEMELLPMLAELHLESGEVARAAPLVAELKKGRDKLTIRDGTVVMDAGTRRDILVEYLEARIHMRQREWSPAAQLLSFARPHLARSQSAVLGKIDFLLGLCYEQLGNPDQAVLVYQESVKNSPSFKASLSARRKVALTLSALDRLEEAIQEYRQIRAFVEAPTEERAQVDIALAQALIQKNFRSPEKTRQWGEIKQLLAEVNKTPNAADVSLLQAQVLFFEDNQNIGRVRQMLEKLRSAHPERVDYWLALASLAFRDGTDRALKADKALDIVHEAQKHPKVTDHAALLLAKMRLLSYKDPEQARKTLVQIEPEIATAKEEDRERLQFGLALAYFHVQAHADAARLWGQLAQAQPQNLGLRLVLFELALLNERQKEAEKLLGEIERIEGKGSYWHYGTAYLLYLQAKPKAGDAISAQGRQLLGQARRYLEAVAKLRPSWHVVPALEGQIDDLEDRQERAIDGMQRALELGERRAAVVRRLVELLLQRNRLIEADQAIRSLLDQEQTLLAAGLGKLAAQSLLSSDVGRGLELALKSVPRNSQDYKDHLWLGHTLWVAAGTRPGKEMNERKAQAEAELKLACELGATAPETWETYLAHLIKDGRREDAEKVLAQTKTKMPSKLLSLTLARANDWLGNKEQAEKHFLEALVSHPKKAVVQTALADFYFKWPQYAKAEPILREIVNDRFSEHRSRARRPLAWILGNKGRYEDFKKALELLEENLRQGSDPADQAAKALLLATHPAHRKEAIGLLEDLGRQSVLGPEQLFTLARLHIQENPLKAGFHYRRLVTSPEGRVPLYYANYIVHLVRMKDLQQAQVWLKNLQDLAPGAALTVESEARVLSAQGKHDEAAARLKEFGFRREENLAAAARLLEMLENVSANQTYRRHADEVYQHWVSKYPSPKSFLAQSRFLARKHEVATALDLCEKAMSKGEAGAALAAAVEVLRVNPAAKDHTKRVETWLRKALQEKPKDVDLLLSLADLYDLQTRYSEAIAVYRQVLEHAPNNTLALNNLAWLVGLHERSEESLTLMRRLLAISGPNPEFLDTRGVLLLNFSKTKDALDDLREAVEHQRSGATLVHLSQAYLQAGNAPEARKTYQSAIAAGFRRDLVHPLELPGVARLEGALPKN